MHFIKFIMFVNFQKEFLDPCVKNEKKCVRELLQAIIYIYYSSYQSLARGVGSKVSNLLFRPGFFLPYKGQGGTQVKKAKLCEMIALSLVVSKI